MDCFERVNRERLQALADEGDVVMNYVFDEPEAEGAVGSVVALARDIALSRMRLETTDDEVARRIIYESSEVYGLFARTHPQTFRLMTTKATAVERYAFLRELGFVRRQVVGRGLSQSDADVHVRDMIARHCRESGLEQRDIEEDEAVGERTSSG
jgi:hypothetical protein